MPSRRFFIKTAGLAAISSPLIAAGSFSPNDKIVVGVMGVNSRGNALAQSFAQTDNVEVAFICDVDVRAMNRCVDNVKKLGDKTPKGIGDLRYMLDDADVDVIAIAAPDHWQTTASILAMQAGKHVYVEKPASHNARELKLLVRAQQKYGKQVQLGTQRRSSPLFIEAVSKIHDGAIGRAYYGKAWYANTRGSIGRGTETDPPAWLDYDLWQGPAPRRPFQDNLIHYNWHWFKHWGTGEACNNGTHHMDLCRWALGVGYPTSITSSGGRFHFDDDWEFFDTQIMSFEFEGGKSITWEGRSCNGLPVQGIGVGASIHGDEGSMLLSDSGYTIYDLKGKEIEHRAIDSNTNALNPVGAGDMTDLHIANFCDAIREGTPLNQPIAEGYKAPLMCHLGNIAQFTGQTLHCDPTSGELLVRPIHESAKHGAPQSLWGREYEPGWEPRV